MGILFSSKKHKAYFVAFIESLLLGKAAKREENVYFSSTYTVTKQCV